MPTYAENTPEYRIAQLARQGGDLSDDEVLKAVGYVPHDGTAHRDDLLTQYRSESATADVQAGAIGAEAYSSAFSDWRTNVADAEAYSEHAASAFRSGEPRQEYRDFLTARYADREPG